MYFINVLYQYILCIILIYIYILGYDDLPIIIEQSIEYMLIKIKEIHAYFDALSDGVPPTKLPKYMYKSGIYST